MKKLLCLALIAILALSCAALAEDFPLRCGIVFGDTPDAVKAKETNEIQGSSADMTDKVWFNGPIDGVKGEIRYDFDEETGKLIGMLYSFSSETDKDAADARYLALREDLIAKYGEGLGNTGGSIFLITGPAIEHAVALIQMYRMIGDASYGNYDEWSIQEDGCFVKIDLISYYMSGNGTDYMYKNDLSFRYYTEQDLYDAIAARNSQDQ